MPSPELTINSQEQEIKSNNPEATGADLELSSQEELDSFAESMTQDIDDKTNEALSAGQESLDKANQSIGLDDAEVAQTAEETGSEEQLGEVRQEMGRITSDAKSEIASEAKGDVAKDSRENAETEELVQNEQEYLVKKKNEIIKDGEKDLSKDPKALEKAKTSAESLEARYNDEKTSAEYVQNQLSEFAGKSGLEKESPAELADKKFNPETKKFIIDRLKEHIDRLLLNKENGRFNPEKHQIAAEQTERYLNLIEQAQSDGDLQPDLDAQAVLDMAVENVWTLAYQDRVASENMLGDHGIRHIAGYNIKIAEQIFDELERNGQQPKAADRLMAHQIMIMHDLGYATDPVREGVNNGEFSADKGHNLLSAKILRQRGENPNDAMSKMFSKEQLNLMHQGVLEHDDSKVDFRVSEDSMEARKENLLSAIHIADNTHAFEDKLPELLYSAPDSLKTMRLLKVAGEIGDDALVEELKTQLVAQIENNDSYSKDDKEALVKAAKSLKANSYKFSVGRICGNRPKISIDNKGVITIKVQESAIHQETVKLYGEEEYDQLKKFIADLKGNGFSKKDAAKEMDKEEIECGEKVKIMLDIREERASEHSGDYQKRIENLVKDKEFREYSDQDIKMSEEQARAEGALKIIIDSEKTGDQSKLKGIEAIYRKNGDERLIVDILKDESERLKKQRLELFVKYNADKKV